MSRHAYQSVVVWSDSTKGSTARPRLSSGCKFMAEHAAIHREAHSNTLDVVASAYEREYWRRWPER
ncbi:hypothetical protein HNQ71_003949 [Mesorhizobium sangaii]|uniref:Uncharacterized protein n=1 Tax=Mesorhizobium sangaii TaxID=505389 RepID=A0A841PSD2_9HYPH|nr:hypothetical protein [Mesorhizobium sangaii]